MIPVSLTDCGAAVYLQLTAIMINAYSLSIQCLSPYPLSQLGLKMLYIRSLYGCTVMVDNNGNEVEVMEQVQAEKQLGCVRTDCCSHFNNENSVENADMHLVFMTAGPCFICL